MSDVITNVAYEFEGNTQDIGYNIGRTYHSVYVGSPAYRRRVQPYLDAGGKIAGAPVIVEPEYEPTRDELLKELLTITDEDINNAKVAIRAKRP